MSPPDSRLRRVHSLLGLVPLALYVVFHCWEVWSIFGGRELWLQRFSRFPWRYWIEAVVVLLPLLAHVTLGVVLMVRAHRQRRAASGLDWLQRATGLVALAFVVYHMSHVWHPRLQPMAAAMTAHAALWQRLDLPLHLFAYVVGISCVYFHVVHGAIRAAARWRGSAGRQGQLWAVAMGAAGVVLWGFTLHAVGMFATGSGLVP